MVNFSTMAKKQDQIFEEMDLKTGSRNACSCGTMLAILIVLLVVAVAGSLYLITLIKSRVNRPPAVLHQVSNQDVIAKIQTFFSKPAAAPDASLTITEQELSSVLQTAAAQNEQFPVKGLQVAISQEAIILSGTLTKPLTSDITIHAVPKAKDGQLEFDITKITAGKVTLPELVVDLIEQKVSDLIKDNLQALEGVEVKEVSLRSGEMVIR